MLRVGVIDSGPGPEDQADAARAFMADGAAIAAGPDRLGHGTAVAAIIRRACPGAAIIHAQVFDARPLTSALRVAAALRWFGAMDAARRPDVICMSLGLSADRAPLRRACEALVAGGAVLVAAHPARGAPCFPAAYPGVIAATGDARCGWQDLSQLGPALFGAWCNSPEHAPPGMGGASLGAARVAGHLAAIMTGAGRLDGPAAIAALAARALHHGPERKSGHG
ncbi:subtilisin-like serine protease QhpE [Paracoccus simplex]|uniref:Subtilisin n=1 Tax=Paracoccus simplex TaxID=2086346 RepID=A0ABV7RXE3_9RHOB